MELTLDQALMKLVHSHKARLVRLRNLIIIQLPYIHDPKPRVNKKKLYFERYFRSFKQIALRAIFVIYK